MSRLGIRLVGAICFAVWAGGANADGLEWSDSGITGPKYSKILEDLEALAAEHPQLVSVVDYGESVKGKTLRMLVVKKPNFLNRKGGRRPTLVMSGSTHGNEYLNIEDRLPRELVQRAERGGEIADFINQGGAFVFVPILNPDGYEARKRENAHGVDLNRDWDVEPASFHGFKEKETKLLADKLDELHQGEAQLNYEITIDYHCCIGAVLHPWGYTKDKMATADLQRHQAVGNLAEQHLDIEVGPTGDILGYFPIGTTKDYYFSKYGAVSFTFEGRRRVEKENFPRHVAWWESMVGWLGHQYRLPLLHSSTKRVRHPFPLFAD